jgi:hypothetical protein
MQDQRIRGRDDQAQRDGRPVERAVGNPPTHELLWCEGCGDRVPRLDEEGRCPLCEEVDARLDAHVASAMADLVERFSELAVCYLHPDDVREIVDHTVAEYDGPPSGPRLREVYERSHRFVEARERRARERHRRGGI